jgi:hypothetical protein
MNETSGACSTYGGEGRFILVGRPGDGDQLEDPSVDGNNIKLDYKK